MISVFYDGLAEENAKKALTSCFIRGKFLINLE